MRARWARAFFSLRWETRLTDLVDRVQDCIGPLGYDLVDLRQGKAGRRIRLQIRIDRAEAGSGAASGVTIDECATVSRELERWLDAEQLLGPDYVLEVSSPGIERPVRWRRHWERFVGRDVNIRLPGRPRQRATIMGIEPGDIVVLRPQAGGEDIAVALGEVREATLAVNWDEIGHAQADHADLDGQRSNKG